MTESTDNQQRPAKKRRRLVRWLIVLLVVGLGVVLALPTIISSGPGTNFIVGRINQRIAGTVRIDDLNISWVGGQEVAGLRILDPQGNMVLSVGRVDGAEASLWGLLRGRRNVGQIELTNIRGDIVQDEAGQTNLARALAGPDQAYVTRPPTAPPPGTHSDDGAVLPSELSFALVLRDVELSYVGPNMDAIELTLPHGQIDFRNPQQIHVDLDARVEQADRSGRVQVAAKLNDLFDAAGRLELDKAKVEADIALAKLPVVALDRLLEAEGKLVALLGPQFDAQLQARGSLKQLAFQVEAVSEHLHASNHLVIDSKGLGVRGDNKLELQITPEAWAAFTAASPDADASGLLAMTTMTLELNALHVPLDDGQLQWAEAALDIGFQMTPTQLESPEYGKISFAQTSGHVQADGIDPGRSRLTAHLTSPQAVFRRGVRDEVTISDLSVHVVADDLHKLSARATATIVRDSATAGQLDVAVEIDKLFDNQGQLALGTAKIKPHVQIDDLPVDLVDQIMGMEGRLLALLGPSVTLRADGVYVADAPGGINVQLTGPNTQAQMQMSFDQRQVTLAADAPVSLTLTRELSNVMLKPINPLFIQAVSATEPIGLAIYQEGFSLSLDHPDLTSVDAEATLKLGTINLENGGLLSLLLRTLRQDQPRQLTASFSPLHVSLHDGVISYRDMTMTMDSIVLQFRGSSNLKTRKWDLVLTMPAEALDHIFNASEVFGSQYSLDIPIGGSFDTGPQVDFGIIMREMARAAAMEALEKNLGPEGKLIGDILGGLLGQGRQENDAPRSNDDNPQR